MVEQDILTLLEEADNNNDIDQMRQAYQIGKRNLNEMPKVNDIFAFFMYQRGCFDEALDASIIAIKENRNQLMKRNHAKAFFDYALCNYNALDIATGAGINDERLLASYCANGLYYFKVSQDRYFKFMESKSDPPDESGNTWWMIDAPVLIQQYYTGELLSRKSFLILLKRIKVSEKDFDIFLNINLTYRMFLYSIDRIVKSMKSAPSSVNPMLQGVIQQAMNRYRELRQATVHNLQKLERESGKNINSYRESTLRPSFYILSERLNGIASKDPYFQDI